MADTYTLHIAGLTRELPICKVNDHMDIAAFIMFSDVELTEACAAALLKKAPEFDVILTAEARGMPLASAVRITSKSGHFSSRALAQAMVSSTSLNMMNAAMSRWSLILQMGN